MIFIKKIKAEIVFCTLKHCQLCMFYNFIATEIRLIIFFAAKDGEALYSQQKQDWELTMAHIMNS